MNVPKIIIDILGIGIEIYISFLFFSIFWEMKNFNKCFFMVSVSCIGLLNVLVFIFSWDNYLHLIMFVLVRFLFTLYFKSPLSSKILFAFILSALDMVLELTVGVVMSRVLTFTIEHIQNNLFTYAVGLFSAKLLTLIVIYLIKLTFPFKKRQSSTRFDLLMLFLPAQSLILCFVIFGITTSVSEPRINFLSMLALVISFLLLIVVAYLFKRQLESLEYKQKYELSQARLQTQIEHYNELYSTGQEIRSIRHDMKNNLIIIAGFLEDNNIREATGYIEKIQSGIQFAERAVDTGLPAIDAVLSAKINEAEANKAEIKYKIIVDDQLFVDQSDIAIVLASALDNAVEAVSKDLSVNTGINVLISSKSDYISVIVENHTSEIVDKNMKTSKQDKANHGFGICQMKAIAEKYDGVLTTGFEPETQKFSLKILLKNRKI